MRKLLVVSVVLALISGCKITGQKVDPRPYSETRKYVIAAKAQKISVSLAQFSAIAEKDTFTRHWKYLGWAQTLRTKDGKKFYTEMGDQACYSGYLTAGLVYNLLNDPKNKTKRAHLKKALDLHRIKTLACGRVGYVPRGFTDYDCPVWATYKWTRCAPPYEKYMYYSKRGPSPGQVMGTMYGLFKAATLLKSVDRELANLARETLHDIGNDLIATGFILKKPNGFPTTVPFFLLRGPKIFIPGVGHITMGSGKYKKTYVNLAEKYNLNCLSTMLMLYRVTGDRKFKVWYDTFINENRYKGLYRATIEYESLRIGKGSSHLGTMAALEFLHPLPDDEAMDEYEKALRVWGEKTKSWECVLWQCAYYNMRKKNKAEISEICKRRLESWSGLPRLEIQIVNSNRPDIELKRKGISGYVSRYPIPRCESKRAGFWPVKSPFQLDGNACAREYNALDFVMSYQYAKYLGLVD